MDSNIESLSEIILSACENGEVTLLQELIAKDKSLIHVKDSDHYTPLHRAAYNNHTKIIKVLLDAGATINSKTLDGWTPLHSASNWNNFESVQLLLKEGADINALTNSGQTPLHLAASNRNAKETLKLLLLNKLCKSDIKNSCGDTAFEIAQRCGPYGYMFVNDSVLNPF